MAVDSRGPRNAPVFSATGASDDAADLTTLGGLMVELGTRRTGTSDERKALDTAWLFNGLTWYETDTKRTYIVDGGAWALRDYYSGLLALPNRSGNFRPVDGAGFRVDGHQRVIEGQLTKVINNAETALASGDRMFTLNEEDRPQYRRRFTCSGGGGAVFIVEVGVDGLVQISSVATGSSTYVRLEGILFYV
jgi:hypothetical protein